MTAAAATKTKALCVATPCMSVDQFVATFHKYCDESTIFVATLASRPIGLETAFSIELADRTPVLQGLCEIVDAWGTPANPFGRPGIRLQIRRLTRPSVDVFQKLRARRVAEARAAGAAAPPKLTPPPTAGLPKIPLPPLPPGAMPPPEAAPEKVVRTESASSGVPVSVPAPVVTNPYPFVATVAPAKVAEPVPEPPAKPVPPKLPAWATSRATPPATPVITIMPHARAAQAAPEPFIDAEVPTVVRDLPKAAADPLPDALEATTAVREPPPEVMAKSKPTAADVAREASEAVAAKLRAKAAESIARTSGPIPRLDPEPEPPPLQEPTPPPPPPAPPEEPTVETRAPELPEPPPSEPAFEPERIPGSELVLPANPLMNLTDSSLQGFIDCTLYEETGNFFAAPDGGDGEHEGPRAPSLIGLENLEAISEPLVFDPPPGAHPEVTQGLIDSKPLRAPARDESDDVAVIVAPALPSVTLPAPPKSAALPALRAKLRRRWLPISAGAAVLGVIGGVLVVAGSSASSGDKPAPVHRAAAPPDAAPVKPPAGSDDETAPPPPGSGPPVVGKGPCRVVVEATPAGSTVQVDGKPVGPSPIAIDGPCQKTQIEVLHARYVTAQKVVEPVAGTPEKVDVTLERPTHAVMVVTTPPGAMISLDGRRAGVSPTVVQVIGFQAMRLTADKPGFTSKTVTLYSRVPRDRISVTLDRALFPPKAKP